MLKAIWVYLLDVNWSEAQEDSEREKRLASYQLSLRAILEKHIDVVGAHYQFLLGFV